MSDYTKILENGERVPITAREALRELRGHIRKQVPSLPEGPTGDAQIDLVAIGLMRETGAKPRDLEKLVIQAATDLVLGMVPYPSPQSPLSNRPVTSRWPKKRKRGRKKRRNPI